MSEVDRIELVESSGNVFADLGFEPEVATQLLDKSELVSVLRRFKEERGLSQGELSKLVDIPQPRLSRLFNGKIGETSTDKLLSAITKLGGYVTIRVERHPRHENAGRVEMEIA